MDGRIKYRHIAAFVEIVRRGSLRHAADCLNLTQPAISRTLRDLEEILGATLLMRDRGGVRLTAQGETFLQFAEVSLSALQQGVRSVNQDETHGGGQLTIGALPSVAARVLPRAREAFAKLSPETIVSVEDGPHAYLIDRLRSGVLDLIVGRLGDPDTMNGVTFTQLYTERTMFVVRPDHPLVSMSGMLDLSAWPFIYPPKGAAIRALVDRLVVAQGLAGLQIEHETVSGAYGRELTLCSDAIWIISEGVVRRDLEAGRLARLPIDTELTAGPVGIMARAEEDPPPLTRLYRHAIRTAVEELGLI